jgi:hypothetical protein
VQSWRVVSLISVAFHFPIAVGAGTVDVTGSHSYPCPWSGFVVKSGTNTYDQNVARERNYDSEALLIMQLMLWDDALRKAMLTSDYFAFSCPFIIANEHEGYQR